MSSIVEPCNKLGLLRFGFLILFALIYFISGRHSKADALSLCRAQRNVGAAAPSFGT